MGMQKKGSGEEVEKMTDYTEMFLYKEKDGSLRRF